MNLKNLMTVAAISLIVGCSSQESAGTATTEVPAVTAEQVQTVETVPAVNTTDVQNASGTTTTCPEGSTLVDGVCQVTPGEASAPAAH